MCSSVTLFDLLAIQANLCGSLYVSLVLPFRFLVTGFVPSGHYNLLMPSCLSAWASSDIALQRSIFFRLFFLHFFFFRLATLPDSFYYILISSIRPFRQINDDLNFAKKRFWFFALSHLFALEYFVLY